MKFQLCPVKNYDTLCSYHLFIKLFLGWYCSLGHRKSTPIDDQTSLLECISLKMTARKLIDYRYRWNWFNILMISMLWLMWYFIQIDHECNISMLNVFQISWFSYCSGKSISILSDTREGAKQHYFCYHVNTFKVKKTVVVI